MPDKNKILLCLHCGNKAPFDIKNVVTSYEMVSFISGEEEEMEYYYTTVQCMSCKEVMLLGEAEFSDNLGDLSTHAVLYLLKNTYPQQYHLK